MLCVYTDKGWKLFKDLGNEKIWALNPDTHIPEFVDYVKLIKQKADKVVLYEGNSFNLCK